VSMTVEKQFCVHNRLSRFVELCGAEPSETSEVRRRFGPCFSHNPELPTMALTASTRTMTRWSDEIGVKALWI